MFCLSSVIIITLWVSISQAAVTVSITSAIGRSEHVCIRYCLDYGFGKDLGNALGCEVPLDNNCYCATDSASASVASQFLNKCASQSCGRGDMTRDLASMRSYYSGYCNDNTLTLGAGWTAAAATVTSNAEATSTSISPSSTAHSDKSRKTTDLPGLTATTDDGLTKTTPKPDLGVTFSWGAGQETQSPNSERKNDSDTKKNIGIGLGIGIPVAAIIAGVVVWLCMRRRKNLSHNSDLAPPYTHQVEVSESQREQINTLPAPYSAISKTDFKTTASVSPIVRSAPGTPVQGKTQELYSPGVTREMDTRVVYDPDRNNGEQIPSQHYEMSGRQTRQEMEARSTHTRAWELPGR